jgi:hypothetical protein
MSEILKMYEKKCEDYSDIHEHLPELRKRASECETVAEFGVRYVVSTWAFLASGAKRVYSYDIDEPVDILECKRVCEREKKHWDFFKESTLDAVLPEDVDFLFVDTLHTYAQVKGELGRHASRVRKYIAFHDTQTYGKEGMDGGEGIGKAINEFLRRNRNWKTAYMTDRNNGLLIIKKQEPKKSRLTLARIFRKLLKILGAGRS